MPRATKETHLYFSQGDEAIEIESYDKKLNAIILKLRNAEPDAVYIHDEEQSGFLKCSVQRKNLTFRTVRTPSEECRAAQSASGKLHTANLKNNKSKK